MKLLPRESPCSGGSRPSKSPRSEYSTCYFFSLNVTDACVLSQLNCRVQLPPF
jgi:hypothetical protein